jgi:hypothetical protein
MIVALIFAAALTLIVFAAIPLTIGALVYLIARLARIGRN